MPAYGGTTASTEIANSDWLEVNEVVFVRSGGSTAYMIVASVPDSTHVTLTNPATGNTTADDYYNNAAPGTVFGALTTIKSGGLQGPPGLVPADALLVANNLNDVASVSDSRNNLGLGTAAVEDIGVADGNVVIINDVAGLAVDDFLQATATGVKGIDAATAVTALGLGTMATQDANAVAITGGSITSITDLAVGDGGTGASTAAAARTNLGVLPGYGLLVESLAIDLNSAGDTTLTMPSGTYIIDKMQVNNASISLTTATAGVFTGAGGTGTTLAADQALSALTASSKFLDLTPQSIVGTDTRTEGTLYFRVGTPQGAAATGDFRIYGYKL